MGVFLAQGYALEPTDGLLGLLASTSKCPNHLYVYLLVPVLIDYFQTSAKASIQYREIVSQYSYMLLVTV